MIQLTNQFIWKRINKLYNNFSYSSITQKRKNNKFTNQQYNSSWSTVDEYCRYCKGIKIICCLSCGGSGKEYLGAMKETMCVVCNGCGYNTCNFCGGSGINYMM